MAEHQPRSIGDIKKEFIRTVEVLAFTKHKWQVWQDFVELSALSLAQSTGFQKDREEQYMRIVQGYTREEANTIPKLLALVVEAFEVKPQDFLGELFMDLELGSKRHGQFFTPLHICEMMAETTISLKSFEDNKIVSICEPTVGSGAMVIAVCNYLKRKKINYQRQLKIVVQDKDYIAFCMAYIQLTLMGCSAIVIHGDTLDPGPNYKTWYTLMAVIRYQAHWMDPGQTTQNQVQDTVS